MPGFGGTQSKAASLSEYLTVISTTQVLASFGYKHVLGKNERKQDVGVDLSKEQRCRLCTTIKPLARFHINRNTRSGRANCCKTCDQIRIRGSRIGLSLAELQERARAGTLADVPGLLLPNLLRAIQNPDVDPGARRVVCRSQLAQRAQRGDVKPIACEHGARLSANVTFSVVRWLYIHRSAAVFADDAPQVPEGMRRCKQCLKPKPVASFVRNHRHSVDGEMRGDFCAPCTKTNKHARTRCMTASELIDMVMMQDDYDLKPAETESTLRCKFCLRSLPTRVFGRASYSVRNPLLRPVTFAGRSAFEAVVQAQERMNLCSAFAPRVSA